MRGNEQASSSLSLPPSMNERGGQKKTFHLHFIQPFFGIADNSLCYV